MTMDPLVDARRRPEEGDARGISCLRATVAGLDARLGRPGHSERVGLYSVLIGVRVGFPRASLARLLLAAQLHDVGSSSIPAHVLNAARPLAADERALVRSHPVASEAALLQVGLVEESRWVRHHHERWDGQGYPDGLRGEAIPFQSRIIAGAERLEALTARRAYRPALTSKEAVGCVAACASTALDKNVAAALTEMLMEGLAGAADTRAS
jgi:HD-GYP domain-containing protein (c-di-GMP phosphodiesterase class II)